MIAGNSCERHWVMWWTKLKTGWMGTGEDKRSLKLRAFGEGKLRRNRKSPKRDPFGREADKHGFGQWTLRTNL